MAVFPFRRSTMGLSGAGASCRPFDGAERAVQGTAGGCAGRSSVCDVRSAQAASDSLLEDGPGLLAILLLPLGVEAGLSERLPEGSRIGIVEEHALGGQIVLEAAIQLRHVLALGHGGGVEMLGHDRAQALRQPIPGAAVCQE